MQHLEAFEGCNPAMQYCDYDDGSENSERSKDWDAEPGDDRWRMYDENDHGDE